MEGTSARQPQRQGTSTRQPRSLTCRARAHGSPGPHISAIQGRVLVCSAYSSPVSFQACSRRKEGMRAARAVCTSPLHQCSIRLCATCAQLAVLSPCPHHGRVGTTLPPQHCCPMSPCPAPSVNRRFRVGRLQLFCLPPTAVWERSLAPSKCVRDRAPTPLPSAVASSPAPHPAPNPAAQCSGQLTSALLCPF